MRTFSSNAQEIRYWTKQLLADGNEYGVGEIKEYVKNKSEKDFTVGTYAGALRDLVANEKDYETVARGIYKNVSFNVGTTGTSLSTKILISIKKILKQTISDIRSQCGEINPLDMTEQEFAELSKIQQIIDDIQKIEDEISDN